MWWKWEYSWTQKLQSEATDVSIVLKMWNKKTRMLIRTYLREISLGEMVVVMIEGYYIVLVSSFPGPTRETIKLVIAYVETSLNYFCEKVVSFSCVHHWSWGKGFSRKDSHFLYWTRGKYYFGALYGWWESMYETTLRDSGRFILHVLMRSIRLGGEVFIHPLWIRHLEDD